MRPASAAVTAELDPPAGLRVLALLEATHVTGIVRNVFEYARMARHGIGGVPVAVRIALIRRGDEGRWREDAVLETAAALQIPVEVIVERHRYDQQVVGRLRALIDHRSPHIIETHHVKSHCLLALSGAWRDHCWVGFHHGYTQTDLKVRAYNHVDRWSLRRAAHVVTTNQPFVHMLAAQGVARARISVLHNGVREPAIREGAIALTRRALGVSGAERVVLAVGRLSREKGHAYLIRAAALWRADACLVIVGEGPERRDLEQLARSLGLGRPVIFTGASGDVAPFYGLADVLVLPSLSEGSPNVLLEAMACGLPIVATTVGGVPEIAEHGVTAVLGPACKAAFLASGVDRLLSDRELAARLGAAARRLVLSRYTHERRAETLSRLYLAIAGTGVYPGRRTALKTG
ncbi:MAG: glycosyltransferase [Acidobacteriota bacterium]